LGNSRPSYFHFKLLWVAEVAEYHLCYRHVAQMRIVDGSWEFRKSQYSARILIDLQPVGGLCFPQRGHLPGHNQDRFLCLNPFALLPRPIRSPNARPTCFPFASFRSSLCASNPAGTEQRPLDSHWMRATRRRCCPAAMPSARRSRFCLPHPHPVNLSFKDSQPPSPKPPPRISRIQPPWRPSNLLQVNSSRIPT